MSTVQNAFLNRDLDIHATQTTQIRSSYITQDVTFKQKSNKVWHDGKIIHYMLFVCLFVCISQVVLVVPDHHLQTFKDADVLLGDHRLIQRF